MRILITGARGQLGQSLQSALQGHNVIATSRPEYDVTRKDIVPRIVSIQPDLVIHAAAMTDVDACEVKPEDAYLQNAEGAKNVAVACHECNASMIYVSTDYVFDGTKGEAYLETDIPNPINVYGKSKLQGENFATSILEKVYVVRTGWLYGRGGSNFVTKIMARAKNPPVMGVTTQFGSPTFSDDLANAIAELIRIPSFGTYHLANEGGCSRYEWAKALLKCADLDDVLLRPINDWPRPAKIPPNVILENQRAAAYGIVLRPWRDALCSYFNKD